MRYRLAASIVLMLCYVACGEKSPTSSSENPPAGNPPASNCTAPTPVAPPAEGGTLVSGTVSTFTVGGTYLVPSGALRLTGTGNGRVVLTAAQGSASSNAPFTMNFTGPGSLLFEPFQAGSQSVTMTLCAP